MKFSKSFIKGFRKVLDVNGVTKSKAELSDGFKQDALAIREDWNNVGRYVEVGMRKYNISKK